MVCCLIHAFPIDAAMWERQVRTLEDAGWPVVAPSLPGFGDTDGVGPTMTMGAAADRCLQAADAAGIERFVVCGLSMGGYVAFELWRMARQRVAGLVLANTPIGRRRAGGRAGPTRAGRPPGRRGERVPGGAAAAAPQRPGLRRTLGAGPRLDRAQPAASIGAAARGMAERTDSRRPRAIDVPVLIVTSSLDTFIPAAVSAEMRDHHRDAGLVKIPGAGHLSNLEAPEALIRHCWRSSPPSIGLEYSSRPNRGGNRSPVD